MITFTPDMKRLLGCAIAIAALAGPLVSAASAAFPGANGLLAVAPCTIQA